MSPPFKLLYVIAALLVFLVLFLMPEPDIDAALIAKLQAARPPVTGTNGYAALRELPPADEAVKKIACPRSTSDCLAFAREHEAEYQAVLATLQAWDAQVDTLQTYDYFRPLADEDYASDEWPSFAALTAARSLHARRFLDGEVEAAQRGACRDILLGQRLLRSQDLLPLSLVGAAMTDRNVELLAHIRAKLPPDAPWPAPCDTLQPLPQETLALCPLMYGEWQGIRQDAQKQGKKGSFTQQALLQVLHDKAAYCAPDIQAAVLRDEVLRPAKTWLPQYCSLFNPQCWGIRQDNAPYQGRLLNVNRYLRALVVLRDPTAPLPEGYRRENGQLHFLRHPNYKKEEGMQAVVLPLPASSLHIYRNIYTGQTRHALRKPAY